MILRTDPRNIIILVLAVVVFFAFDGCSRVAGMFNGQEVVGTSTTTKTTITVKERKYLDFQPYPDFFKPTKQRIQIKNGKVSEVPNDTPIDTTNGNQIEDVNKYELVSELPNGTIKSTLLIRGELLSTEYLLTTRDTTTTIEKETVNNIAQSGLFGVAGSTIGLDGRIKDIQAGFSYLHKSRVYFEAGGQYDVDPKIILSPKDRAGVILKVGFKF